ncbi:hypothetical protein K435DRAFT_272424 [Dendrothele bispora CBS 962.96]|uniref:Uncharacterized protein n=1 Tax=Dendrothele bispora (strain CBS 962.96) TaxID=1314807 RepID=A0A4S8LM94_DENBC|nr:hypothetical protein K435DRAFT_272424 [Dendrothele bispora CBS 962.96]
MHKLRSLLRRIERTPTAGRDENWNYLHEELLATRETLAKLHDRPRISLATDTIVQALQQCHESIQDALTEYTALSQMEGGQILRDIHGKVGKIELSIQNGFGNQERLLQMIKSTITIMDAIGHEFLCDAVMATDPKFIHKFLKLTFEGKNSATDKMLLEFLDKKQYNLCIDQGIQVVLFESKEEGELLVEPGTKVVMNVILTQEKQEVGYECPVCGTWNSSTDHTANSAKDCSNRGCPGRFQIIDDRNDNSNDVGNWGSGEGTLACSETSILNNMIHLYSVSVLISSSQNVPLTLLSAHSHSDFQIVSVLISNSQNVPLMK